MEDLGDLGIKIEEEEPLTYIDPVRRAPNTGWLKYLSDEDVEIIRKRAVWICEKLGFKCQHKETLDIYREGKCKVEGEMVYIPYEVLTENISKAPNKILMAARDPQHDLILKKWRVYTGSGGAPIWVLPAGKNKPRFSRLRDNISFGKLADAGAEIDFLLRPTEPQDLRVGVERDLNKAFWSLHSSAKHVMVGYLDTQERARKVLEMAEIIAGGEDEFKKRPIISLVVCPMSGPRRFDHRVLGSLIEWARWKKPLATSIDPMKGFSGPPFSAELLANIHAEQLALDVLIQLIEPGAPHLPGYVIGVGNTEYSSLAGQKPGEIVDYEKEGSYSIYLGADPIGLKLNAAVAQLAYDPPFWDVPCYNTAGLSDAKVPGWQSGMEEVAGLLPSMLAGIPYIHHAVGLHPNMDCVCYEDYIFSNAALYVCKELCKPIRVIPGKTIGLKCVNEALPGKSFYASDEMEQAMKKEEGEFCYPPSRVISRDPRDIWEKAGMPTDRKQAIKEVKEILEKWETPFPISEEVEMEVRKKFPQIVEDPFKRRKLRV